MVSKLAGYLKTTNRADNMLVAASGTLIAYEEDSGFEIKSRIMSGL